MQNISIDDEEQSHKEPTAQKMPMSIDDEEQTCQEAVSNNASMQTPFVKEDIITPTVVQDALNQFDPNKVDKVVKFYVSVLITQYEKNGKKPIPYFRYVVDTQSFKNTVDNMVITSIIVNKGMTQIDVDENNVIILSPVEEEKLLEFQANGGENSSVIISLSYEQWKMFSDGADGSEGYIQEAMNQAVNA